MGKDASKRLFTDPENVYNLFNILAGIDTNFESRSRGLELTKEDLLSEFFKYLYNMVSLQYGNYSVKSVISVPVWFDSVQTSSIIKAAERAGCTENTIILNPVAAFLAYNPVKEVKKFNIVLINDFGGGSFDATLLRVGNEIVVLGSQSDKSCSGSGIEKEIVETIFIPALKKSYPHLNFNNIELNPIYYKMLFAAEKAKIELSSFVESKILEDLGSDENGELIELSYTLKQNELHQIMDPYIVQSINICSKILKENEIKSSDVVFMLMVGGQSLSPYWMEYFRAEFNILMFEQEQLMIPNHLTPLTVISYGAAIYGETYSPILTSHPTILNEHKKTEDEENFIELDDELEGGKVKTHDFDEDVQLTVLRPKKIKPEKWYDLLAFAHLSEKRPNAPKNEPDPIQEVQRQAKQILQEKIDDYGEIVQDSSQAVPREGKITFVPQINGITFNPPEQTFYWYESVHREHFRLKTSQKHDGKTLRGNFTVFLGNIILCDINLAIKVDSKISNRDTSLKSVTANAFRKIFASYSHNDLAIVNEFEHYGSSVGDQYLIDQNHLRTGEIWNDRLMEMIKEADIFQLFWSWNSIRSEFVHKEYEYALSLNRNNFIRPVYWEKPFPQIPEKNLPPEELCQIQFGKIRPVMHSLTKNTQIGENTLGIDKNSEIRRYRGLNKDISEEDLMLINKYLQERGLEPIPDDMKIDENALKKLKEIIRDNPNIKNSNLYTDRGHSSMVEGGKRKSIMEKSKYKLDGGKQPTLLDYSLGDRGYSSRDGGARPSASSEFSGSCCIGIIIIIVMIFIIIWFIF